MTLAVAFITSRLRPCFDWFADSLRPQGVVDQMIVVDSFAEQEGRKELFREIAGREIEHVEPKPNVWQGNYRLPSKDCWAVSNARNTALCLCRSDWVAFLDDRCVLMPGWLNAIQAAMVGNYSVFGSYEKRHNMTVENGIIINAGVVTGQDNRVHQMPMISRCPGEWSYGCSLALPLEWALGINGWDETCDGAGFEDVFFGTMLKNCGKDCRFDASMKIVEDRTPSETGPDIFKTDKGVSPNDKSHAMVDRLKGRRKTMHAWNLREVRDKVLRGEPFPIPTTPTTDWFDGQPLSEM